MASIKKRGKYWQARVDYYDCDHKRHFKNKSGFTTKREAQVWATEKENELNHGKDISTKNIEFVEYFKNWYHLYKEPILSTATKNRYKLIENELTVFFAHDLLIDITRNQYQAFINKYGKNHAKSSVLKLNSIVKACIQEALYNNIIYKDFTYNVTIVYDEKRDIKVDYLNLSEIKRLVKYILKTRNKHFTSKYMILTAIYTGARLGEIQALTWEDIDFEKETISINKSWDYINGGGFKKTKTKDSNRVIKVPYQFLNILSELNCNNKSMVFTSQYGSIPTSNAVNKTLRDCLMKLNINRINFHFHSLRHSHVAFLLSKGIDIYSISKRLGHSDTTTTTRIYAYLIDEYQNNTNEKIITELSKLI